MKYKEKSPYNSIPSYQKSGKVGKNKKVADVTNPSINWGTGTVNYTKTTSKKLANNQTKQQQEQKKQQQKVQDNKNKVRYSDAVYNNEIDWKKGTVTNTRKSEREVKANVSKIAKDQLTGVRKRFYENLSPYNYDTEDANMFQRLGNTLISNEKEKDRELFDQDIEAARKDPKNFKSKLGYGSSSYETARYDALNRYMGLPQEFDTFKEAEYKPSGGDENKPVYEFNNPQIKEYLKEISKRPDLFDDKGVILDTDKEVSGVMSNFKISKGKDDKGEYLSYYDVWDFKDPLGVDVEFGNKYDIYGRYYLNDKTVKDNPKFAKQIKEREKELLEKKKQRTTERNINKYNTTLGTPGIRQYGGGIPHAQWGDLLSTGPLAELFRSGQDWSKAWRGDIFAKDSLLNKTIYQNQKDRNADEMYGDPNSPFYDPNYKENVKTSTDQSAAYQEYLDAKLKAEQTGQPLDQAYWNQKLGGIESFEEKVKESSDKVKNYEPKTNPQKLQATAQGIFSGLQYQGAYQQPEPVKLQEGFQGTQWARYGNNVNKNNQNMNRRSLTINEINRFIYGGIPYAQYGEYMNPTQIDPSTLPENIDSGSLFGGDNMEREVNIDRIVSASQPTEVKRTTQDPVNVISSLRKFGLLKGFSDEQILNMAPQDQDNLFKAEMNYFNQNDPRSAYAKQPSGNVSEIITIPLSATTKEVIPGLPIPPQRSEEEMFIDWYRKQPEGTIQEYNGRKIKIDRSGKPGKQSSGSNRRVVAIDNPGAAAGPDKVIIRSGLARDIYNKRYGGNSYYYQDGGPVNYSGYTPGYQSSMNPMNIIPGQNVTMNPQGNPPVKEPLLAIANFGKKKDYKGTNHGLIKNLEPGDEWNVPGASKIVEIKKDYKQDTSMGKYGSTIDNNTRYGGNINPYLLANRIVPNFQVSGEVPPQYSYNVKNINEDLPTMINGYLSSSNEPEIRTNVSIGGAATSGDNETDYNIVRDSNGRSYIQYNGRSVPISNSTEGDQGTSNSEILRNLPTDKEKLKAIYDKGIDNYYMPDMEFYGHRPYPMNDASQFTPFSPEYDNAINDYGKRLDWIAREEGEKSIHKGDRKFLENWRKNNNVPVVYPKPGEESSSSQPNNNSSIITNPKSESVYTDPLEFLYRKANEDRQYLDQIAGSEQLGPGVSTQEFNQRMLNARDAATIKANDEANPYGYSPITGRGMKIGIGPEQSNPYGFDPATGRAPQVGTLPGEVPASDENQCSPDDPNCIDNPLRNEEVDKPIRFKNDPYEYRLNKRGEVESRKKGSNKWIDLSTAKNIDYDQVKINLANAMASGSRVKKFRYGGDINNDHTYPIHPITEEFTEIQTEKGETVFLPDGTIVEVKADKLHKNMDKDKVTDILPEGAYIFSRDPFMKMGPNTKIGGIRLEDMKVGKTVFEYKENEITTGPQDIMISDIFNLNKDMTPADISRNIKKKFEVRDMKNDFFVQRANDENKKQRVEYFEILKTFSEFKKPKSKRQIPKAQYGMGLSNNLELDNIFNTQANNTLDNIMGYSNNLLDPYSKVDNNIKSKFNFENGGSVPHAAIGDLVKLSPAYWVGDYFVRKKADKENKKLAAERSGIWDQKAQSLKQTGAMNMLTNVGTTAAAMNVPDYKYNDYGAEFATTQEAANRARAINQANTYGMSQGLAAPSSLARYAGSNQNLGNYLAQATSNNAALMQGAAQQQAQAELATADALNRYRTAGMDAYNQTANAKMQAMQAATTQGLGNIGRSATDYLSSKGEMQFDRGMDKMSYDQFLAQRKQAARDRFENQAKGIYDGIAQVGMMFLPGGQLAGLGKGAAGAAGAAGSSINPNINFGSNFKDFSNPAFMSPISDRFNTNNQFPFTNNTIVPGGTVDRSGTKFNIPFNFG